MKKINQQGEKIGILTFHWADDYGAMLQAYGLKKALLDLNKNAVIIPYSNNNLSGRYWLFRWVGVREKNTNPFKNFDIPVIKRNLKHFFHFHKKRTLMKKFRHAYLSGHFSVKHPVFLHLKHYDRIVIGSDQVWNPEITVGVDPMYLGNFPKKDGAKIISYAASLGKECLDADDGQIIGNLIDQNFSSVSVREKSSIAFMSKFTHKNICAMPDPTFLCNRQAWEKLVKNPGIKEDFVLIYTTENNKLLNNFALSLCKKYNLQLIDARTLPIGPSEFLWLVKNAKHVITNSFHCTVFSIMFHKSFYVFSHSDKNVRLKDLLNNVGLEDRLASDFSTDSILKNPDWNLVDNHLEKMMCEGKTYLNTNL